PLPPRVLAATLLERDELRTTGLLDELRRNLGSRDGRRSDLRRPVASDHQHFREFHLGTRLTLDLLDDEDVVLGNTVLLAAGLDDCVHDVSFFSTPCGAAISISRTLLNRLTLGETVYRPDAGEEPRAAPLARWPKPPRARAISSGQRRKSMF